jgi:ribose transport system substrate-binding protein
MCRVLGCVLALLIAASGSGCGKKSGAVEKEDEASQANADANRGPALTEPDQDTDLTALDEPKPRKEVSETKVQAEVKPLAISIVPPVGSSDFVKALRRGAERAADDLKQKGRPITLVWNAPDKEFNVPTQIAQLKALRESGIDGAVVVPVEPKEVAEALKDTAQKVPIVLAHTGLDRATMDQEAGRILTLVGPDQLNAGKVAAEKLLAALAADRKTEPKIVVLRYLAGAREAGRCEKGFLDAIKDAQAKGSKVKIVSDDKFAGPGPDTAQRVAEDVLTQLGDDVDGFFCSTEPTALGLIQVLKAKGKSKAVVAVGVSETLLSAVRDGDLRGIVAFDPHLTGYMAVWLIVQYLDGYDVEMFGPFVPTPETYVDKNNIDTEQGRALLSAESQARRIIELPSLEKRKKP